MTTLRRAPETSMKKRKSHSARRQRSKKEKFDRMKAEFGQAFAAPESTYAPMSAAQVIARNQT